jgi:hypothetical protein
MKFDQCARAAGGERECFIENLLVRIYLIIEMMLVDRPFAMRVGIPFSRGPYI